MLAGVREGIRITRRSEHVDAESGQPGLIEDPARLEVTSSLRSVRTNCIACVDRRGEIRGAHGVRRRRTRACRAARLAAVAWSRPRAEPSRLQRPRAASPRQVLLDLRDLLRERVLRILGPRQPHAVHRKPAKSSRASRSRRRGPCARACATTARCPFVTVGCRARPPPSLIPVVFAPSVPQSISTCFSWPPTSNVIRKQSPSPSGTSGRGRAAPNARPPRRGRAACSSDGWSRRRSASRRSCYSPGHVVAPPRRWMASGKSPVKSGKRFALSSKLAPKYGARRLQACDRRLLRRSSRAALVARLRMQYRIFSRRSRPRSCAAFERHRCRAGRRDRSEVPRLQQSDEELGIDVPSGPAAARNVPCEPRTAVPARRRGTARPSAVGVGREMLRQPPVQLAAHAALQVEHVLPRLWHVVVALGKRYSCEREALQPFCRACDGRTSSLCGPCARPGSPR